MKIKKKKPKEIKKILRCFVPCYQNYRVFSWNWDFLTSTALTERYSNERLSHESAQWIIERYMIDF